MNLGPFQFIKGFLRNKNLREALTFFFAETSEDFCCIPDIKKCFRNAFDAYAFVWFLASGYFLSVITICK